MRRDREGAAHGRCGRIGKTFKVERAIAGRDATLNIP
jgi:hypothetical protein